MASLKICLSTKIQISIVIKFIRQDADNCFANKIIIYLFLILTTTKIDSRSRIKNLPW